LTNQNTRASLLILGFAAFMVNADARVVEPLLHPVSREFGVDVARAAIVGSAYTLPYGLFQLFYGPLGDRIGKLKVKAMALTLFAIGTAACAAVPNLAAFAILRFLTGVVAAAIIPLSLAYIGDKFPYEERQAALGRFMSAIMLGQIISVTIGGVFGEYLGWRGIFVVFGVISLLIAGGLWRESKRFPEEPKAPPGAKLINLKPFGALLQNPPSRLVILAVFIEGFCFFGGQFYLAASLKDRFGLDYAKAGLILAGVGIGGLIYSVTVKKLVKQIGEMGILVLGGVLMSLGFLLVSLLTTWTVAFPCMILLGMGFYTMHSTLQTKATEMAPGARGTAVSFFAFALFLGQSTGVYTFGQIVKWQSYSTAFAVAGIAVALLMIWARIMFPRMKPKASDAASPAK
jgi:predicted MFS family arabinose efflux permease